VPEAHQAARRDEDDDEEDQPEPRRVALRTERLLQELR
jgi:hypothetical protein